MLSWPVLLLCSWQALCALSFLIVEIVIHSLNSDLSGGQYLQLLANQSMQIYQYLFVIMAGMVICMCLSQAIDTRAARCASMMIQVFGFLAWFYVLYFVIPVFSSSDRSSAQVTANVFCDRFFAPYIGVDSTPELSVCRLSRAVAALALAMQLGFVGNAIYAVTRVMAPVRLVEATSEELMEDDDKEVMTAAKDQPDGSSTALQRIQLLTLFNVGLCLCTLLGYALLMFAMIKVANANGLLPLGSVSQTGTMLAYQLGEFFLSANFRQLSLTLSFSLAGSAYAAYRHNRGIHAGALMLCTVSAIQWWSIIILSGRYLHQWQTGYKGLPEYLDPTDGGFPYLADYTTYPALAAQKAMFAGACLVLTGETLRALILFARYLTFIPVTRDSIVPTFVRGALSTANSVSVALFVFECVATVVWFVFQFVSESDSGVFNAVSGNGSLPLASPFNVPLQNSVSEALFIWHTMIFLAMFITELFSERSKTLASKLMAFSINIVLIAVYLLQSWPWAYAGVAAGGAFTDGSHFGPLPTVGFCNGQDNQGSDNCALMKGAAILSFITALGYVMLALHQLIAIIVLLPTPGVAALTDGSVVNILPSNLPIQHAVGGVVVLMLSGLLVWSLTGIDVGKDYVGWASWTFGHEFTTPGFAQSSTTLTSLIIPYLYAVSFADLIVVAFTIFVAVELSANPVIANWRAWRALVVWQTFIALAFLLPQLILICRYINWGGALYVSPTATSAGYTVTAGLTRQEKAFSAGFLILCCAVFTLFGLSIAALRSPQIPMAEGPMGKAFGMQPLASGKQSGDVQAVKIEFITAPSSTNSNNAQDVMKEG